MRPTCNSFHFFKENPNHFTAEIWILEAHLPMYWLGNWVDLAINRFCIPWKNLLTVTCFPFFWSRMPIFFEGAVMRIVAAEKTLLLTPGRIRKIINFFCDKVRCMYLKRRKNYDIRLWHGENIDEALSRMNIHCWEVCTPVTLHITDSYNCHKLESLVKSFMF